MHTNQPLRSVRRFLTLLLSLLLIAAPVLRADVTIRYKNDFKFGSLLSTAIAQGSMGDFKSPVPAVIIVQIKGVKGYTDAGPFETLVDFTTEELTLIDAAHKQFATTYMKNYADQLGAALPAMPVLPPEAQAIMDSLKVNFSVRKTGRTDMIQGVQVEENELTLTVDMPLPIGIGAPGAALPAGRPITMMKMVMQTWTAAAPEIARMPALAEWNAYKSSSAAYFLNPFTGLQKLMSNLPGFGRAFSPMFDELMKNQALLLKSHTELYMPILAQAAPLLRAQGKLPQGFDPNAPLLEINSEVVELSGTPIDGSVFQVPADYRATPLPDLMKSLRPVPTVPSPGKVP